MTDRSKSITLTMDGLAAGRNRYIFLKDPAKGMTFDNIDFSLEIVKLRTFMNLYYSSRLASEIDPAVERQTKRLIQDYQMALFAQRMAGQESSVYDLKNGFIKAASEEDPVVDFYKPAPAGYLRGDGSGIAAPDNKPNFYAVNSEDGIKISFSLSGAPEERIPLYMNNFWYLITGQPNRYSRPRSRSYSSSWSAPRIPMPCPRLRYFTI